jgi:hypothetical protein
VATLRFGQIALLAAVTLLGTASAQAAVVYSEDFSGTPNPAPNQTLAGAGWAVDTLETAKTRRYLDGTDVRVYSYASAAREEAFYSSTTLDTGATGTAFPSIDPATNTGITFGTDLQAGFNGGNVSAKWLVQVGGAWYASATTVTTASATFVPFTLAYDPTKLNWLTTTGITGTGTTAVNPAVVGAPASDLSGPITGAGLFIQRTGSNTTGTYNFDNFSVTATEVVTPTPVPEPTALGVLGLGAMGLFARRRRA